LAIINGDTGAAGRADLEILLVAALGWCRWAGTGQGLDAEWDGKPFAIIVQAHQMLSRGFLPIRSRYEADNILPLDIESFKGLAGHRGRRRTFYIGLIDIFDLYHEVHVAIIINIQ
jgi:hypothetical protein